MTLTPGEFARKRTAERKQKGKRLPHQLARAEHPSTAKESARKIAPVLNESQEETLVAAKMFPAGTLITGALIDEALGTQDGHKRLNELEDKGELKYEQQVWNPKTKRWIKAWRVR